MCEVYFIYVMRSLLNIGCHVFLKVKCVSVSVFVCMHACVRVCVMRYYTKDTTLIFSKVDGFMCASTTMLIRNI